MYIDRTLTVEVQPDPSGSTPWRAARVHGYSMGRCLVVPCESPLSVWHIPDIATCANAYSMFDAV